MDVKCGDKCAKRRSGFKWKQLVFKRLGLVLQIPPSPPSVDHPIRAMSIALVNGRVMLREGVREGVSVVVAGRGIAALSETIPANTQVVDLAGALAIAVGSEDAGLPEKWLGMAATQVHIPMKGLADSLNVSVSAALLLYEALRQRTKSRQIGRT